MRAAIVRAFGPVEDVAVGEMPTPAPGPDEVLIATRAAAVNFADLLMIAGKYQMKPERPFVPGTNPVGVVMAVGGAVTRVRPGDRVLALTDIGGYAEAVAAPEGRCIPLPDSLAFVEAAAMSFVQETAWFALRDRARLAPGESVLVLGASGGVGLACVQLARALGAGKVLAGISRRDKGALVRDAGADAIVDLAANNLREDLRRQVHALTDGGGADIVLDPLGGEVFDAAIRALAWRGRLVVLGFAAGGIPTLKANYLLVKNIEVTGLQILDYRSRRPDQVAACFAEVFALHAAGKVKAGPVDVYPLDDFQAALRALRERAARGRIVLVPRGDALARLRPGETQDLERQRGVEDRARQAQPVPRRAR